MRTCRFSTLPIDARHGSLTMTLSRRLTIPTEEAAVPYRIISGWSYYEDFTDLSAARARCADLVAQTEPRWSADSLYRKPAIYAPNTDGYYIEPVQ